MDHYQRFKARRLQTVLLDEKIYKEMMTGTTNPKWYKSIPNKDFDAFNKTNTPRT